MMHFWKSALCISELFARCLAYLLIRRGFCSVSAKTTPPPKPVFLTWKSEAPV